MNRASEWAKFYDTDAGRYRYRHKGTGEVRDTLLTIGKHLKKAVAPAVKTAANKVIEQAAEKTVATVAEKGSKKIRQVLQGGKKKTG